MLDALVSPTPLVFLAWYLGLINALAFAFFAWDKFCAIKGRWRVQETTLLVLAFAGGWLGAKLAQLVMRHKTRKQPFAKRLNALPLVWIGLVFVIGAIGTVSPDVFTPREKAEVRQTPKFFRSTLP